MRMGRRIGVVAFLAGALMVGVNIQGAEAQSPTIVGKTLIILGASYADGWGTPKLPGFSRIINQGVGGEETGDMLRRFDRDVIAARPDAVLIWGHVNDITRSPPDKLTATKAQARDHYVQMVEKARAAGVEVILATEVPWTEPAGILNELRSWIGHMRGKKSYGRRVSAEVEELNGFVRDLASRRQARLLDFWRVFVNDEGTRNPDYATEDGSHISQSGYAALTRHATYVLGRTKGREP